LTAEGAENREGRGVDENNICEIILGCAISAHIALGPGLLENSYEACLLTSASSAILCDLRGKLIFKRTLSLAQNLGPARIFN
jgi:hypothetical protein